MDHRSPRPGDVQRYPACPSVNNHMNPKKWNVACWVLIALWLVPFFLGRFPFNSARVPDGVVKQRADGTQIVVYNGRRTGWPIPCIETSQIAATGATTRKFDPMIGLLNLVLVIATIAGIVVVVQTWFRQFSISTLMLSIGGLGILIVLAQTLLMGASHDLKTVILTTLYFSPLAAGIVTMILKRYSYSKRKSAG